MWNNETKEGMVSLKRKRMWGFVGFSSLILFRVRYAVLSRKFFQYFMYPDVGFYFLFLIL